MNWQSPFSAFSPRVSSTTLEPPTSTPTTESSPDQNKSSDTSPSFTSPSSGDSDVPMSRTNTYKKITKPLLERKRRARINRCLDELKDIMTVALQAEGENVSKLEKADILELTVRHLQKMSQARRLLLTRNPLEDLQRFQAGYSSCAQEAATFLLSTPGVDVRVSQRLLSHLSNTASAAIASRLPPISLAMPQPQHLHRPPSFPSPPATTYNPSIPSSSRTMPSPPLPPLPKTPEADPQTLTLTQGSFTLSIRRQTPEPLTERSQNEKSLPIKPAAIRLNPGDQAEPVWRPYHN